MNHLICPLCCQQDFTSIVALREHLLYYIYRPITCPICNLAVGGIHGLTRHLELQHIDNKQIPYSVDNNDRKDIGIDIQKNKINMKGSVMPFYQNPGAANAFQERNLLCDSEPNADLMLDLKENADHEHNNAATAALSSKCEPIYKKCGLNDDCIVQSLAFPNEVSANKAANCNSESYFSDLSMNFSNSTNDSSTIEEPDSYLESSSPDYVFSAEVKNKNDIKSAECDSINKSSDGFQTLSDAVRAFVCITCGSKIVGKDLYFKHIQAKCSMDANGLSKVYKKKLDASSENNLINKSDERYRYDKLASHLLSSNHNEKKILEFGSSLNENVCQLNKSFNIDRMSNLSKGLIVENHELRKEEIKPYIHKKFDHDLERKKTQVPSNDVQCYIQNFQSLLVDKLNKTLERDSDKLSFMENIETKKFFEVEREINFRSSSIDCDADKPSPIASLNPEKLVILPKNNIVKSLVNCKPFRCKFCPKSFTKPYLLLRHQLELHSSTTFFCNSCGHHFKSKRTLANHIGTHKGKEFHCTKCDYSCFTASGLRTHVFENHSKKRKRNYICVLCSESFKKKYGLDRHIKRKHENNRILCQYCDKQFSCKEDLSLHKAIHLNGKLLTCSDCGKIFTSLSSLKRHTVTHNSNRKSFNCSKCSKIFTRKDSLQNHIKLHE